MLSYVILLIIYQISDIQSSTFLFLFVDVWSSILSTLTSNSFFCLVKPMNDRWLVWVVSLFENGTSSHSHMLHSLRFVKFQVLDVPVGRSVVEAMFLHLLFLCPSPHPWHFPTALSHPVWISKALPFTLPCRDSSSLGHMKKVTPTYLSQETLNTPSRKWEMAHINFFYTKNKKLRETHSSVELHKSVTT